MITWKKACELAAYNPGESCPVERKKFFFAYKAGKCETFDTIEQARKFSSNIESGYTKDSTEKWDAYWADRKVKEAKARDIWYNALREEYNGMSDGLFNACYSKAYEDGHSAGYDEIASEMETFTEFAETVLRIGK